METEVTRHDLDRVERKARNGFGTGLAGTITGGIALLNQASGGRGIFGLLGGEGGDGGNGGNGGGRHGGMHAPCNGPTPFDAWAKAANDEVALERQMAGAREVDVNEKFQLWKSQVDGDFGLYKVSRDLYDNSTAALNTAAFGLYVSQRDGFDALSARISALEKDVAVNTAIRPYQDQLLQCRINEAYTSAINHADRLDCRNIKGIVCLPNTPTVTGFPNSCGCNSNYQAAAAAG